MVLDNDPFILLPSGKRFIVHSQIPSVLEAFARAIFTNNRSTSGHGVVTLEGLRGTGKHTFLKFFRFWASTNPRTTGPDQIAIISLERLGKKSFGKEAMYTATTLDTLALLWHELQQLNLPPYLRSQKPPNEKVIKHHTEPEFHRMYAGVVQCIKSQHIYAICIDHAEKLDEYTLEWLWHIHEEVDQQFALILCAELQKNEEPSTPFYPLLNYVPNVLDARLGNPVLLPIEAEEFQFKVLPKILRSLEATLAPEVRPHARAFREDFWEWTQGNWHLINRHTWLFDDELGGDKRRPRLLTQDVIDRVYARLKGLKLPSKDD